MKMTERRTIADYVGERTAFLIQELGEECQNVSKLLAQLELSTLQREQAEDLLGELSAAILHLHEHTRGLDERVLERER